MKFNDYFSAVPILETERLILRPFCYDDIKKYIEIIHDSRVQTFMGGSLRDFYEEPHISNWLNNVNNRLLKSKTVFTWCIELKSTNEVIGEIDLGGFVKKSMAEIAYFLTPEYWGQGFATEAVQRVTDFGLQELKLHRIQAKVMPENIASLSVLKKTGYIEEGVLKKYLFGKVLHDTVILAIVDDENLLNKV